MSALAAVESLRERRITRNRRNPGTGLRDGWNGAFLDPAEEAALRLAEREADEKLVADALAQEDTVAEKLAAEAAAAPAALAAVEAPYREARKKLALVLRGGVIKNAAGDVEIVGVLDALAECHSLRKQYESAWEICLKHDLDVGPRIPALAIASELRSMMHLASVA